MASRVDLSDSDSVRRPRRLPQREEHAMHDLILASIFAAMILVPCVVASGSGKSSEEEA
jgi:hypothetical protein